MSAWCRLPLQYDILLCQLLNVENKHVTANGLLFVPRYFVHKKRLITRDTLAHIKIQQGQSLITHIASAFPETQCEFGI